VFVTFDRLQDRYPDQNPTILVNTDKVLSVSPAKSGNVCWLLGLDNKAFCLVHGTLEEIKHKLNAGE